MLTWFAAIMIWILPALNSSADEGSGPSLDETVNFIVKKLDGHEWNCRSDDGGSRTRIQYSVSRTRAGLLIHATTKDTRHDEGKVYYRSVHEYRYLYELGTGKVRCQGLQTEYWTDDANLGPNKKLENVDWNSLKWGDGSEFDRSDYKPHLGKRDEIFKAAIGVGKLWFDADESELAGRVSKAFLRLLDLMGVKDDPF